MTILSRIFDVKNIPISDYKKDLINSLHSVHTYFNVIKCRMTDLGIMKCELWKMALTTKKLKKLRHHFVTSIGTLLPGIQTTWSHVKRFESYCISLPTTHLEVQNLIEYEWCRRKKCPSQNNQSIKPLTTGWAEWAGIDYFIEVLAIIAKKVELGEIALMYEIFA